MLGSYRKDSHDSAFAEYSPLRSISPRPRAPAPERVKGTTRDTAHRGIEVKYSIAGPMTGLSKSRYSEYLIQIISDVSSGGQAGMAK